MQKGNSVSPKQPNEIAVTRMIKTVKLIFSFKALYTAAIIVAATALLVSAQITATTVIGTIQNPDLTPFVGSIDLTFEGTSYSGAQVVTQGKKHVDLKASQKGAFRQSLAPGDWTAAYHPDGASAYEKTWTVPAANSARIGDIESGNPIIPDVSIAPVRINPCAEGQVLGTPRGGPHVTGCVTASTDNTTTAPNWLNVSGETQGSWTYGNNVLGEHAMIKAGKIYAPLSAWQTIGGDNSTSGIAVLDPATGQQLASYVNKTSMLSPCIEAAPAIDIRGHIHAWGCTEVSGLTQIDPATGNVTASLHVPNAVDWEAVPYDPVNDLTFYSSGNASFNGLRALHASDYSTAWTNTDMALGTGGSYTDAPPLIIGGFVYFKDIGGSVYKINLATGATAAFEHNTAVVDGAQTYAQMIYDSVHSLILVTNNDHTAYALNVSDLSVAWSKDIPDTTFSFKRGGAYNPTTGIWFVTARDVPPALGSKVYALDVAAAGNIVWTNTTAYDNAAQISSVLTDDNYVYCGTFDYAANTYNRYLVINAKTGALVETFRLVNGVSSSSPVVWGGKFVMGIWTTFGYQALQVRAGGGTGDFPYKADANMTGYVQPFTSGALLTQPDPGELPGGDALRISSATNIPGGLFLGTCGGKSPGLAPCKIQPSDLGPNASSSTFFRGDGTYATPTASAAPCGSSGQIQYNNSGSCGGFTPKVNSVNITAPSGMNFADSVATNGLTWHFTNPSLGVIQLSVTGTLDNSGLTNSSFTASMPSWLSVGSPVSLGGSLSITPAPGQISHRVVGTCGAATIVSLCALVAADIPALNYQAPLGFTPLNPANNLSDLGSAATARGNLGLGTAATANTGTSGANVPLLNGNNTYSGGSTYIGSTDASGATHTIPSKTGLSASKPATCNQGEEYFATDATAGQNKYLCTAANTWTQQSGGGGGPTLTNLYTQQGANYFWPLFQASGLPDASTWSWVYQPTGATVSPASHALTMYDPFVAAASTVALALYKDNAALGSSSFVLKAAVMNAVMPTGNPPDKTTGGICITDGAKAITFGPESFFGTASVGIIHWTNNTTTSGSGTNRVQMASPSLMWLRISLAASTLSFDFSLDGINYVNVETEGVSSFLSAGTLNACIATSSGSTSPNVTGLTLVDWSH